MLTLLHFLVHWTGSDYGYPYGHFEPYDALSGIAGLSLVGLMYHKFRALNCHQYRCWRIGRHHVDGSVWCNRHHIQAREAAAGPVRAGAGSNPAGEGLNADGPVVPPAAAQVTER